MGSQLKLSIVIPSLNQGEFLPATLDSLFQQQALHPGELEVIVIDGGSRDKTPDILRRYAGALAHCISEPDAGQTDALIKGFALASGEIFGWLCADDLLESRAVRDVLDFFTQTPEAGFVYGDATWIDRGGVPIKGKREIPFNWYIWLHDHNYIPQPAAFFRRSLYKDVNGLDRSFNLAMDTDLFARFAAISPPKHAAKRWARIRSYPEQKNQRLRSQSDQEDQIIRRRFGVNYDNRAAVRCHFWLAKGLRIIWKLARGAYFWDRSMFQKPC